MKRLRNQTALVCLLCLALVAPACNKKVTTDPNAPKGEVTIRTIKLGGIAIEAAVDEGLAFEAGMGEAEIDPAFRQELRTRLNRAKTVLAAFNERAKKYITFDAAVKSDVVKLATDAIGFLEGLNEAGLLKIKNAEKQQRARRIIAGAKLLARGFEVFSQATVSAEVTVSPH